MNGGHVGRAGVSADPTHGEPDLRLPDGRRVVAGAVLLNPGGQVLLQLRDDKPTIESPGQWSLFGGGIDPAETPEEGMLREVAEEIGFRARHHRPLLVFDGLRARYHIYLAAVDEPLSRLTLAEGAGFDYWDVARALAEPKLTEIARLSLTAFEALKDQLARSMRPGAEIIPGAGY